MIEAWAKDQRELREMKHEGRLFGWHRVLLRPHGRSKGRVFKTFTDIHPVWTVVSDDGFWVGYSTRAQAARAIWEEGRGELVARFYAWLLPIEFIQYQSGGNTMNTWYSGHAYYPNPHYDCEGCGRSLGDRYRRLKNPHSFPTIYKTLDGRMLCERCFLSAPQKEGIR